VQTEVALRHGDQVLLIDAREMPVRLTLHDVSGHLVETLLSDRRPAGEHRLEISGAGLAPGLYFLRSESGEAKLSRKVVVAG